MGFQATVINRNYLFKLYIIYDPAYSIIEIMHLLSHILHDWY